MKWSQLQKQVRERTCPELRGRICFHKAVYRKSWESLSTRAWITIDKEEVFACDYHSHSKAYREAEEKFLTAHPDATWQEKTQGAAVSLEEQQILERGFLSHSLHQFLDLSIADALASANPVIRAFAIVDRRTGRRTLARLLITEDDHLLIRRFYLLRKSHSLNGWLLLD